MRKIGLIFTIGMFVLIAIMAGVVYFNDPLSDSDRRLEKAKREFELAQCQHDLGTRSEYRDPIQGELLCRQLIDLRHKQ